MIEKEIDLDELPQPGYDSVPRCLHKHLTPKECLYYAYVEGWQRQGLRCWTSNAKLAEIYSSSPACVSRAINSIIKKGYMRSEMGACSTGTRRYLEVITPKVIEGGSHTNDAIPPGGSHTNDGGGSHTKSATNDIPYDLRVKDDIITSAEASSSSPDSSLPTQSPEAEGKAKSSDSAERPKFGKYTHMSLAAATRYRKEYGEVFFQECVRKLDAWVEQEAPMPGEKESKQYKERKRKAYNGGASFSAWVVGKVKQEIKQGISDAFIYDEQAAVKELKEKGMIQ